MLGAIMLNFFMQSVIMPNVIMLSVIVLSVVVPKRVITWVILRNVTVSNDVFLKMAKSKQVFKNKFNDAIGKKRTLSRFLLLSQTSVLQ